MLRNTLTMEIESQLKEIYDQKFEQLLLETHETVERMQIKRPETKDEEI